MCQTLCLLLWHILSSPFSRPERLALIPVLKVMLIIMANSVEHLCVIHCAEHLMRLHFITLSPPAWEVVCFLLIPFHR